MVEGPSGEDEDEDGDWGGEDDDTVRLAEAGDGCSGCSEERKKAF